SMIALAFSGDSSTSGAAPATATAGAEDDFIYKANGLEYIAEHHVAAEGVQVPLAGEWVEDQRNLTLRLREDGRYEFRSYGSAVYRTNDNNAVAMGSRSSEQGRWSLAGTMLTLTPSAQSVSGSIGSRQVATTQEQAEPPRAWNVVGLTIEYTPHGGQPK